VKAYSSIILCTYNPANTSFSTANILRSVVRVELAFSEVYRGFIRWCVGDGLLEFQVIENTFVELPFKWSALPELLIVVVEAGPVFAEFDEAVLVHVI